MANTSRLYVNEVYRVPIMKNTATNNLSMGIVWGSKEPRSYFPANFDAIYKLTGANCDNTHAYTDISSLSSYVTAQDAATSPDHTHIVTTGYLTSPEFFTEIWCPKSSAADWTKPVKFRANEIAFKDVDIVGTSENRSRSVVNPLITDGRGTVYECRECPKGIWTHKKFGLSYPWKSGHHSLSTDHDPWGFIPCWSNGGMGWPTTSKMPDRMVTFRYDILFGIPVADTKFHFVAFYKSGGKSDFYNNNGIPARTYNESNIKYLYRGVNLTHDTIAGGGSTSGLKKISTTKLENIYHFWSEFKGRKGTHSFVSTIGLAYSGNTNKNKKLQVYDNAAAIRIL